MLAIPPGITERKPLWGQQPEARVEESAHLGQVLRPSGMTGIYKEAGLAPLPRDSQLTPTVCFWLFSGRQAMCAPKDCVFKSSWWQATLSVFVPTLWGHAGEVLVHFRRKAM